MICDELVLVLLRHALKGIELAGKIALELVACINNLLHDFVSLLLGDSWSERIIGEVTADTDSR